MSFKGHVLSFLISDFFPYQKAVIKKNTYKWQKDDVTTISVPSVLIVNKYLSDEDVAFISKQIFENKSDLSDIHSKWNELNVKKVKTFSKDWKEKFHPAVINVIKSMD